MANGATGGDGKSFNRKEVGKFLFYILIIAACIGVLFYILFNARPSVEPKIKNSGQQSELLPPATHQSAAQFRLLELHARMVRVS